MPPRKSNVSQTNAPGEDGTPVKEREGINIEVGQLAISLPRHQLSHTFFTTN